MKTIDNVHRQWVAQISCEVDQVDQLRTSMFEAVDGKLGKNHLLVAESSKVCESFIDLVCTAECIEVLEDIPHVERCFAAKCQFEVYFVKLIPEYQERADIYASKLSVVLEEHLMEQDGLVLSNFQPSGIFIYGSERYAKLIAHCSGVAKVTKLLYDDDPSVLTTCSFLDSL